MNMTLQPCHCHLLNWEVVSKYNIMVSKNRATNWFTLCSFCISFTLTDSAYILTPLHPYLHCINPAASGHELGNLKCQLVKGTNTQWMNLHQRRGSMCRSCQNRHPTCFHCVKNSYQGFWGKYWSRCSLEMWQNTLRRPPPHLLLIKDPIRDSQCKFSTCDCPRWMPS